jgi:Family of unknown function (DUF6401)
MAMSDVSSEIVRQFVLQAGEAGIAKAGRAPGLAAAVDQHAAAVRDVILRSDHELTPRVLLDYLHGFTDAAVERGWWPADEYDWETTRVIAVCRLIRELSV